MASKRHDFIVAAIARKIRAYGFDIVYLDAKHNEIDMHKFELPPQIFHHRPDVIGKKGNAICIGEAKTEHDIENDRARMQFLDFFSFLKPCNESKLILGIPLESKSVLKNLLQKLQLMNSRQIEILCIPETILPYEEEI